MKQNIIKLVLILWFSLWLIFFWRKGSGPEGWLEIARLARLDFANRRKAVYGEEFYQFMDFCRRQLPPGSTFVFEGPDNQSTYRPRAYLELYPHMPCDRPEFIIVFQDPAFPIHKNPLLARYSTGNFILKNLDIP